MLSLFRFIFGPRIHVPAAAHVDPATAAIRAQAAGWARQRLLQQGLLDVELDAQADIKERVLQSRMNREHGRDAHEVGEAQRAEAA